MGPADRGVRVNVTLPPAVHEVVQQYAVATGQTMAGAVTDLLRHVGVGYARRWLAGQVLADVVDRPAPPGRAPARPVKVPVVPSARLRPGPGEGLSLPESPPLSRADRRREKAQKRKSAGR